MSNLDSTPRTYRRIWPEPPRIFEAPSAAPPGQPGRMAGQAHGACAVRDEGNGTGQPPTEILAHLVVALSRYLRHLRQDGGRVPAQLEEFSAFLTTRVGPRHDMSSLDRSSAGSDSSAVPSRLLITKSEAAEQLGVSLRTIERLISAGRLPLVHVESAARVRVADLEAYVQGLEAADRTAPSSAEER